MRPEWLRSCRVSDLASVIGAVGGLAAFVTALGTVIIGIRNSRKADDAATQATIAAKVAEATQAIATKQAEEAKAQIAVLGGGVFEVGRQIDGRLTELLEAEKRLARAEGRVEGVTDEQARIARVLAKLAEGSAVDATEALRAVGVGVVKVVSDDPEPRVKPA